MIFTDGVIGAPAGVLLGCTKKASSPLVLVPPASAVPRPVRAVGPGQAADDTSTPRTSSRVTRTRPPTLSRASLARDGLNDCRAHSVGHGHNPRFAVHHETEVTIRGDKRVENVVCARSANFQALQPDVGRQGAIISAIQAHTTFSTRLSPRMVTSVS